MAWTFNWEENGPRPIFKWKSTLFINEKLFLLNQQQKEETYGLKQIQDIDYNNLTYNMDLIEK